MPERMTEPRPKQRHISEITEVALANIIREAGLVPLIGSREAAARILTAAEARDQKILHERWL